MIFLLSELLKMIESKSIAYAVAVALASVSSIPVVTAAELEGVIFAARDITTTTVTPDQATTDDCPREQKPAAQLPDLQNAAQIDAYRQQLSQQGPVSIVETPFLDNASFKGDITGLMGREINASLLDALRSDTVNYIKSSKTVLADVYIPEQNVNDGRVVVVVKPARIGKIIAKGQQHYDEKQIRCEITQNQGEWLNPGIISDDIQWLNRSSWRRTDVTYTPGEQAGETDILLETQDRHLWRPFYAVSNTGTRALGQIRHQAGISFANVFGLADHEFDYTYSASDYFDRFQGHSLGYRLPVFGRQVLALSADYSYSKNDAEGGLFNNNGDNLLLKADMWKPLGSPSAAPALTHSVHYGLDYKHIGNQLEFDSFSIYNNTNTVAQFYAGYDADLPDRYGSTHLNLLGVYSPGNLLPKNDDEHFDAVRPGAKSQYGYLRGGITRQFALPKDFSFKIRLNGQYSDRELTSSEQFQVTGANAVRGYYEDTLISDSGWVANIEAYSPAIKLGEKGGLMQFLAFRDMGQGYSRTDDYNPDLNKVGRQFNVAGTGVGVRYMWRDNVQISADVAWRDQNEGTTKRPFVHFYGTLAF